MSEPNSGLAWEPVALFAVILFLILAVVLQAIFGAGRARSGRKRKRERGGLTEWLGGSGSGDGADGGD